MALRRRLVVVAWRSPETKNALSARALLWLGIGFLEFGVCISIARVLLRPGFDRLDDAIIRAFASVRLPWLTAAAGDATALGSFTVAGIISLVAMTMSWRTRHRGAALQVLASFAGATLLGHAIKNMLHRARPHEVVPLVHASGFSDPSGHALTAASVYLTLAIITSWLLPAGKARRTVIFAGIAVSLLVGLSRIYLGVHYATDVVTGLAFGAAWAFLAGSYFAVRYGRLNG